MPPSRSRYVTACQQLLALGVVLVALAPATRVVSLDVVGGTPTPSIGGGLGQRSASEARPSAYRVHPGAHLRTHRHAEHRRGPAGDRR